MTTGSEVATVAFPGPASALVTLPVAADRHGIARVLTLERLVRDSMVDVRATIPAFNRLLVEGSPATWEPDEVEKTLRAAAAACLRGKPPVPAEGDSVVLPVCYDRELGPDLESWAAGAGLSVEEAVGLHCGRTYTVLATGFAPGFAYLGDVDERIAAPRRPSPRRRVAAGSVGIADRRTGVYPADSPGGWQLIGRVPSALFADAAERTARFTPGARVAFRQIGPKEFAAACR